MSLTARLTVDLGAIASNWTALDRMSGGAETAAAVKADGYGCGIAPVGRTLLRAGARTFFVAQASEGTALRAALGPEPVIYVLGGYPLPGTFGHAAAGQARHHPPPTPRDGGGLADQADAGDIWVADEAAAFSQADLRPVLNGPEQVAAWIAGPDGPCALQLDTGMNRLGLEAGELASLDRLPAKMALIMSHLACSDDPGHPMNAEQLGAFRAMTAALDAPCSLAATGGTLLGGDYHFDMVRPGVGLYGGLPFADAAPVVALEVPILQVRDVAPGEAVGYGGSWQARRPSRVATISAGYADGLHRLMSNRARAFVDGVPCGFAGRVSMDLIGLDVTDAPAARAGGVVEILGPHQGVDTLAAAADTIGYEVLTGLGPRYARRYVE